MEKALTTLVIFVQILFIIIYINFELNFIDKRYTEINILVLFLTMYWIYIKEFNLLSLVSHSLFGLSLAFSYAFVKSKILLTFAFIITCVTFITRWIYSDCIFDYMKKYEKNIPETLFARPKINIDFILVLLAYLFLLKIIDFEPK